jgi:hypothetical protein
VQRREIKYIANDLVPIDSQGTLVLPKVPERPMVEDYFKQKSLDDSVIAEHLQANLNKLFTAIAKKDEATVYELTEPTFA